MAGSTLTKKELLHLRREREKLDRSLGGIRDMARVPSAVWVVDTKKEHIAVSEARKLGIPVIAILDTNCDPDEVTYPIPGNDDAIRSVALLTRVVADAVADGLIARAGAAAGEEKPAAPGADGQLGAAEPLAEWERELLLEGKTEAAQANGTAEASTASTAAASTSAEANGTAAATAETTAEASTETSTEATPEATTEATTEASTTVAPPEPAADDSGTHPRPGSAEAESSDPLAAEPDAIDPQDEVPTDELPADEQPSASADA